MKKIGLGLLLLGASITTQTTHAESYYSLAGFDRLMGLSYEYAWDRSSAFVQGGAFWDNSGLNFDELGFAVGYRHYLMKQPAWEDSWFMGGNVGQYYSPEYFKPGIGYEIGYQWMGVKSRIAVAGNLGFTTDAFAEESDTNVSPRIGLNFSLGYRGGSAADYIDKELEIPTERPSL